MKSKRGAEMTIGTLVIIVLAILVLVVLVVGFTSGWSNLWGKITGIFGGGSTVDDAVRSCNLACTTANKQASDAFCCQERQVKLTDASTKTPIHCLDSPIKEKLDPECKAISCPADYCSGPQETIEVDLAAAKNKCVDLCKDLTTKPAVTQVSICGSKVAYLDNTIKKSLDCKTEGECSSSGNCD